MRWTLALASLALCVGCARAPATPAPEGARGGEGDYRARVHTELAAQYYSRRQYSIALEELREALATDPGYAPAYNVLGLLHGDLAEDREAEAHFRHALQLAPNYSEAHNNFGYFLCLRGRQDEAIAQFEQAVQNPLYASPEKALANAASCSLRQGRSAEAERYAQRALVRAPGQPVALITLAEVQFSRGDFAQARAHLRQLENLGPLDASGLWLGLRVERQLGNRVAEADYGAQLRRRYPDAQETRWLLNGRYDLWGNKP